MKRFALFFLGLFFLQACQPAETDLNAPILNIYSFSPNRVSDTICGQLEPDNVIHLRTGDTLKMNLNLIDNEELAQLKVDIHANFDCHGHRSPTLDSWSVLDLIDLSGSEQDLELFYVPPTDAWAGNYHFQLRLLDASGNETGGSTAYSIKLISSQDSIAPEIRLNSPQSSLIANRGSQIFFEGEALDNMDLTGGKLELRYESPSGNIQLAQDLALTAGSGTNYNFNWPYTIPNSLAAGNYRYFLRIIDAVGNTTESSSVDIQLN